MKIQVVQLKVIRKGRQNANFEKRTKIHDRL